MAKIYVGNLSWNVNDDTLRETFGEYGSVLDSIVMRDRETGKVYITRTFFYLNLITYFLVCRPFKRVRVCYLFHGI